MGCNCGKKRVSSKKTKPSTKVKVTLKSGKSRKR